MSTLTTIYNYITVIYHSHDMDGWTSGAILQQRYPGCHLLGYDYGEPVPAIPEGTTWIIMVDVSMQPDEMRALAAQTIFGLTYIDHHDSKIQQIADDCAKQPYNIGILNRTDRTHLAACELTWQYCYPSTEIPLYVSMIGCADVNRTYTTYSKEYIHCIVRGIMEEGFTSVATCPGYLYKHYNIEKLHMLYIRGYKALQKQTDQQLAYCKKHAFEDTLAGYRVICLETPDFGPQLFAGVFDANKHDIMCKFWWQESSKLYVCSLYSIDSERINVATIAANIPDGNGGGHAYAAGFQVKDIKKNITQL